MNQRAVKEHIKSINQSIIYLSNINDKGGLVLAINDLFYYESLVNGFSIPALNRMVSN